MREVMKLFIHYVNDRKAVLLYEGICLLVFIVVFYSASLAMEPIFYAAGVCLFLGLCFHGFCFARYIHRHRKRMRMMNSVDLSWSELETSSLAEEDLKQMIAQLSDKCSALTQANAMAERERNDYYTTWVHQVKTPITVMRLLLEPGDDEEAMLLKDELFRIEQYAEMALNYVRLGSDYVFADVSLDEIIRKSVRSFASQFVRRHLYLRYEGCSTHLITDAKWLQFIIEQLLSNALKYTREGGITITVLDTDIMIQDTGIGIASADLPMIFERGYTGYNGHQEHRSTGLGLYLCRKAGEQLQIEIEARSEVGKGSTFILHIHQKNLMFD